MSSSGYGNSKISSNSNCNVQLEIFNDQGFKVNINHNNNVVNTVCDVFYNNCDKNRKTPLQDLKGNGQNKSAQNVGLVFSMNSNNVGDQLLTVNIGDYSRLTPQNERIPRFQFNVKVIRRNNTRYHVNENEWTQFYKKANIQKKLLLKNDVQQLTPSVSSNNVKLSEFTHRDKEHHSANSFPQTSGIQSIINLDADEHNVDVSLLYVPVYIGSAIRNMLQKELKFQLTKSFVKHIATLKNTNRTIVVNWIIQVLTYMKSEPNTLYTTIKLLDKAIDGMEIPLQMLQLVALAAMWISTKYHDRQQRVAKLMVLLCDGAYTIKELNKMEWTLLKMNKFEICTIDISTYIHYYILVLNISNAHILAECSHYLLSCSYLSDAFVFIPPSQMAAGVVFTSLYLMNQYSDQLWNQLKGHLGFYHPKDLKLMREKILPILKDINRPGFPFKEPFYAYSSKIHDKISLVIQKNLTHHQY